MEKQGESTSWYCSATWLAVLGVLVMGLVLMLSLADHSNLGSFLVATCCSAKMDSNQEDSGRLVEHIASPFDLSRILPVGGGLLVLCSSLGPLVLK